MTAWKLQALAEEQGENEELAAARQEIEMQLQEAEKNIAEQEAALERVRLFQIQITKP